MRPASKRLVFFLYFFPIIFEIFLKKFRKVHLHQSPDAKMRTVFSISHPPIANFQHIRVCKTQLVELEKEKETRREREGRKQLKFGSAPVV